MNFDFRKFQKEALTLFLLSFFIFILTCISLFAHINTHVLSIVSAEPAGYVSYFDTHYDASNNATIKQVIGLLEEEAADGYSANIYVLDKDTNTIISSNGDVPGAVKERLLSDVNEKLIAIDESTCSVSNFTHYKVFVKASVPEIFAVLVELVTSFALTMLGAFVVALLLLALVHRFFAEGSTGRLVATVVLILAVVFSFAGNVLFLELETIDSANEIEASNLKLDVEDIYRNPDLFKLTDQAQLVEVVNSIAKETETIKEVAASTSLQGKAISASSVDEINDSLQIVTDETAVGNLKMVSYIEALLMFLLAFMVVYELQKKARNKQKLKASGTVAALTANDSRMRTVLMVNGICTSAFNIVNGVRIRQVVMYYWTDNVAVIVSTIFTVTLIASVLGSAVSSLILRKCNSVKTFSILGLGIGIAGALMCGLSSNIVVFLAGLMIFNVARSLIMMLADFYTTLLSDIARKDSCQIEFASGTSLGQVIGNIIGGVFSVVLSFAFVQVMTAACLAVSLFICLSFSNSELLVKTDESRKPKLNPVDAVKYLINLDVLVYSICIVLPSSIAFILVQYKLPLDVAALGLSAVVISLAKTSQKVVRIYANPLYHVVSRHMSLPAHLVAYISISGAIVLFYMLSNSLMGMVFSVAALGFMDGIGYYATTKAFREMDALSGAQESDRMVSLDIVRRIGDTASPTLLSVFGNGAVLPVMIIVAPFLYLAKVKAKARG